MSIPKNSSQSIFNVKKGDTLSHIAVHVLKKNKEKVTPEAINLMVNNIALRNKIKNPDLIFPGQKIVLEFKEEVPSDLNTVVKGSENTQSQALSIGEKGDSGNLSLARNRIKKNQLELGRK